MVKRLTQPAAQEIDVSKVINFFGGREALAVALEKHSIVKITRYALDKWVARGDIPAARLEDLKSLARARQIDFQIAEFRKAA